MQGQAAAVVEQEEFLWRPGALVFRTEAEFVADAVLRPHQLMVRNAGGWLRTDGWPGIRIEGGQRVALGGHFRSGARTLFLPSRGKPADAEVIQVFGDQAADAVDGGGGQER